MFTQGKPSTFKAVSLRETEGPWVRRAQLCQLSHSQPRVHGLRTPHVQVYMKTCPRARRRVCPSGEALYSVAPA